MYAVKFTVSQDWVLILSTSSLTDSDDDDDDDDEVMRDPKIVFKSTKNLVCNSQWVGGHRYTRILLVSKLLWE